MSVSAPAAVVTTKLSPTEFQIVLDSIDDAITNCENLLRSTPTDAVGIRLRRESRARRDQLLALKARLA